MKRRWEAAHDYYTLSLIDCPFADSHGGKCRDYFGAIERDKTRAAHWARRENEKRRSAGRDGRFVVEVHRSEAGWVHEATLAELAEVKS